MRETVLPAHALLTFVRMGGDDRSTQTDGRTDRQGPEVTVVEKTLTHFACSSLVSKHTLAFFTFSFLYRVFIK